jgi:hypothetical protein
VPERRQAGEGGAARSGRRLAPGEGEFGPSGRWLTLLGWLVGAAVYAAGWWLEDTRYWLDGRAVAVWAVALPLWVLFVGAVRRSRSHVWGWAFLFGVVVFGVHLLGVFYVSGRINDEAVGIAGGYAAAATVGWWVGRAIHLLIRRRRAAFPPVASPAK